MWTTTVPMTVARYSASATLLPNGAVLIMGGSGSTDVSADLYVNSPTAGDVTYTRAVGNDLQIATTNLLTRGTGIPGAATAFGLTSLGPSGQGATIVTNNDSILYTAANDNNDSFTYTVTSNTGDVATGTIHVLVIDPAATSLPANSVSAYGNTATIRGLGIPGHDYILQTATSSAGPWSLVGTNAASADGSLLFLDSSATNFQQYYRTTQP